MPNFDDNGTTYTFARWTMTQTIAENGNVTQTFTAVFEAVEAPPSTTAILASIASIETEIANLDESEFTPLSWAAFKAAHGLITHTATMSLIELQQVYIELLQALALLEPYVPTAETVTITAIFLNGEEGEHSRQIERANFAAINKPTLTNTAMHVFAGWELISVSEAATVRTYTFEAVWIEIDTSGTTEEPCTDDILLAIATIQNDVIDALYKEDFTALSWSKFNEALSAIVYDDEMTLIELQQVYIEFHQALALLQPYIPETNAVTLTIIFTSRGVELQRRVVGVNANAHIAPAMPNFNEDGVDHRFVRWNLVQTVDGNGNITQAFMAEWAEVQNLGNELDFISDVFPFIILGFSALLTCIGVVLIAKAGRKSKRMDD